MGKQAFLLATGSEPLLPQGFEVPIRRTARYFGMEWGAVYYGVAGKEQQVLSGEASTFLASFKG